MVYVAGYTIAEIIDSGIRNQVYRGIRNTDRQPVVIKILQSEHPGLEDITRLRQEYSIPKQIDSSGIIHPYSLENYQNSFALILEDFGGQSLKQFLESHSLELEDFLKIAISLTETLNTLHQTLIIHKDIKPSNIIIHPETKAVKLTDFGIAINLPREQQALLNPNLIEGTLAYMSPEQTGRMNRSLDYRTDFYSLGVTFYEMLAGTRPFTSTDPMELVHCHLAKSPIPLINECSEIPQVLSNIVMKLMAKNAEDRYQSAVGLKFDLERCLQQLEMTGEIVLFPVGERDRGTQLLIPQKLYGREEEVARLLAAFERVSAGSSEFRIQNSELIQEVKGQGTSNSPHLPISPSPQTEQFSHSELVLVAGYSGIGKTSIVNEVHKPIVEARGYFIAGKFDQFKRDIPYAAIIQAFQELVRQLLTESEEQIAIWKANLLEALGSNGQIVIDVIPEVELIIGSQPDVPQVGATESQNRFNRVFQQFVRVFCQPQHPLVIFLDDLQWVDSASLNLIQLLITDESSQYLLLIGAYRDNEVSPTHTLVQTLEKIQATDATISTITVQPLSLVHVRQLIADTLNAKVGEEELQDFAELIFSKTQGNPFFLTQLLKTLYAEDLLVYQIESNCWQWDIEEIQALGITDYSVVELISRNIRKLPETTQNVLKLAACVGNQFNLEVLSIVSEASERITAEYLWDALQAGLILPVDERYKIPLVFAPEELSKVRDVKVDYRFLHDRVQQAAYSLIPEADKKLTHLKIGQLLQKSMTPQERVENIFALVNQLNFGTNLLKEKSSKYELAEFNLVAGKKAKKNTAYEASVSYFNIGIKLLEKTSWETRYDLTFSLYFELAESEYLSANLENAERLFELAFDKLNNELNRIVFYELKIKISCAKNEMEQALEVGKEALKTLNISLVESAPQDLDVKSLVDLPKMIDKQKLAAMQTLMLMWAPACFSQSPITLSILYTMLDISRKHGNSPASIYTYSVYSVIVSWLLPDLDLAYELGKVAFQILDILDAREFKAKAYVSIYINTNTKKHHIRETIEPLLVALQSALEVGDIEFACYAASYYCRHLFFKGDYLKTVKEEHKKYLGFIDDFDQSHQLYLVKITGQLSEFLSIEKKKSKRERALFGSFMDEDLVTQELKDANNTLALFGVYYSKCLIFYLFRDTKEALKYAELADNISGFVQAEFLFVEHNFVFSLSILDSLDRDSLKDNTSQLVFLKKVAENQEKMQYWAHHAPMNFQHKYDLVEAEKARVLGQTLEAMEYYDRAIAGARENGYVQHEALANELAGEFYLDLGRKKVARTYLIDAYYAYIRWGAIAKVEDLEIRYPQIFDRLQAQRDRGVDVTRTAIATTSSSNSTDVLDLPTVMKAYEAISEEIVLDQLLEKLLQIALKNAGAEKGLLILRDLHNEESPWRIEASGTNTDEMAVLQSRPVTGQDLPLSLFNYATRSQETVVLDAATQDDRFAPDSYIVTRQPQSILCTPILHKGKLKGIFYLENNQATGAFTRHRLELLNLLSTQAAISIENAQLYTNLQHFNENLENLVQQRTQELSNALDELKATQKQLVESEKMAALGNLVAGVAHEINTPLGIGITAASVLADKAKSCFNDYQNGAMKRSTLEKFLDVSLQSSSMVLSNLNRAAELVQSFKQVAVDRATEVRRTIQLKEYLEECLIPLRPELKHTQQRVEVRGDDSFTLNSYPGPISQIVTNLVMNSLIHAYSPEDEGLMVFEFRAQGDRIILSYRDDGRGIDPENLDKIFDPFFTTRRGQGGTGLGLHLVYNLATQKLKGQIRCESQVGIGTTFTIELPPRIDADEED